MRIKALLVFIFLLSSRQILLAACSGNISVINSKNQLNFNDTNTFTVTVTNPNPLPLVVDVRDEIWLDTDCNGQADASECQRLGFGPECGWGTTDYVQNQWSNVSLQTNSQTELVWSHSLWAPNFCYVHHTYYYSLPLAASNPCYQNSTQGYTDSTLGNLQAIHHQAKFQALPSSIISSPSTNFGLVTHIDEHNFSLNKSTQNISNLQKDIDTFSSGFGPSLNIIRIGLGSWEIVNSATPQEIFWRQDVLTRLDSLFDYINQKGFKIILVLNPWDNPAAWCQGSSCPEFQPENYYRYLTRYYSYLAQRWQSKIWVWNPFNESEQACFTTQLGPCKTKLIFQELPPHYLSSDEYLNTQASVFSVISQAIKSADPKALLTAHVGNYPLSYWYFRSIKFFDKINPYIDILSTSLYPHRDQNLTNLMPQITDYLKLRYHKPVFVVETGLQDSGGQECSEPVAEDSANSPPSRGGLLTQYLQKLNRHADTILVYQIRDDISLVWDCTKYGLISTNDTLKPSFYAYQNFIRSLPANTCSNPNNPIGDFNCDGQTNIADFGTWKQQYLLYQNTLQNPLPLSSDANHDDKVNLADFILWKQNFLK